MLRCYTARINATYREQGQSSRGQKFRQLAPASQNYRLLSTQCAELGPIMAYIYMVTTQSTCRGPVSSRRHLFHLESDGSLELRERAVAVSM